MDSAQGSDLTPIFGDLNQSEKLSEIKPPLIVWPLVACLDEFNLYFLDFSVKHEPVGPTNNNEAFLQTAQENCDSWLQ